MTTFNWWTDHFHSFTYYVIQTKLKSYRISNPSHPKEIFNYTRSNIAYSLLIPLKLIFVEKKLKAHFSVGKFHPSKLSLSDSIHPHFILDLKGPRQSWTNTMKDVPNWSFKLLFKSVALPQVICKKKKIELASGEHTHGYLEEGSHS